MKIAFGFLCGLIFGVGLVISGMSNPAKVLNFLDIFGTWDPSLAFVMGGAVLVALVGYRIAARETSTLLGETFHLPTRKDVDGKLLSGAAVLGVGWRVGGFCPGPAFTALPSISTGILAFFLFGNIDRHVGGADSTGYDASARLRRRR